MKKVYVFLLCLAAPFTTLQAENSAVSMQSLLEQVHNGSKADQLMNRQRRDEFRQDRAQQNRRLEAAQQQQQAMETESDRLEHLFEENEHDLANLQDRLDERLGSLKELFGVLQQVAGDANGKFENAITQIHYPQRKTFLLDFANKMGQTSQLPSIAEIEQLWFELQREMTASGQVISTRLPVLTRNGEETQADVIRVGNFNLIADGKYFQYIPETGRIVEYSRQPNSRYMSGAEQIASTTEPVLFTIDPLRGQLLGLMVLAPKLSERLAQGGLIGYAIIGLGLVGILLALFKLVFLSITDLKIDRQKKALDNAGSNPLGKVVATYDTVKEQSPEVIELKLSETILREIPKVNRGVALLKIIAAVAPLMGLLGTVTGMIITFQAITLFGAGDPKLMAGGISQALVTTVLGLCAAIPVLLLHTLVQSRAQNIREVLEQEAVALVAGRAQTTAATA